SAERAQISGTLGSNDTIQFSLPSGPQTITLTGGALNLTRNVTVTGPGAANLTLSGNHANRVFRVFSGLNVTLSGLTIADGTVVSASADYGGGLYNSGTLALNNCIFSGNTAGANGGGGIYNEGALTLNGCTFSGNNVVGDDGGGGLLNNA